MHWLSYYARTAISSGIAIIMILPAIVYAQASNNFTIKSYIPEKFVDFQSTLISELKFGGDRFTIDQDDYDFFGGSYANYKHKEASNNRNFYLQSASTYRYETVPEYLDLTLNIDNRFSGMLDWNKDNYSDSTGISRRDYHKEKMDAYFLTLYPSIDAGKYFMDNFFLSTNSTISFSYSNTWNNYSKDDGMNTYSPNPGYFESSHHVDITDKNQYSVSVNLDLSAFAGWGHVYEGRFASTAMYLVDELRDKNLLIYEPSEAQMIALAEMLYQFRLQHYFDSRLHNIKVVDDITDYLTAQGLISENLPRSATVIDDVWRYFPNTSRRFGLRIRGGGGFSYDYYRYNSANKYEQNNYLTSYYADSASVIDTLSESFDEHRSKSMSYSKVPFPYIMGMIEYFNPLNLKWQIDLYLTGKYYLNPTSTRVYKSYSGPGLDLVSSERDKYYFENYYEFSSSANARYIFNSRTSASLAGELGYWHYKRKLVSSDYFENSGETTESFNNPPRWKWYCYVSTGIEYRITIPMTLNISASYRSNERLNNELYATTHGHRSQYSLDARLLYYLF